VAEEDHKQQQSPPANTHHSFGSIASQIQGTLKKRLAFRLMLPTKNTQATRMALGIYQLVIT
jgi:hypothetical protein